MPCLMGCDIAMTIHALTRAIVLEESKVGALGVQLLHSSNQCQWCSPKSFGDVTLEFYTTFATTNERVLLHTDLLLSQSVVFEWLGRFF